MTIYISDTHALLWYLFSPEKLSEAALNAFETIQPDDVLVIPTLVVAEMVMVVEKRRIQTILDELQNVIKALKQEETCLFPPLTAEDILVSTMFTQIPDIFDRLIVNEAHKHSAILITKDETIIQSGLVNTLW